MKTEKPKNPFAFSCATPQGNGIVKQNGMTLRDYFAAKSMQSIIVSSKHDNYTGNNGMPVPNFVSEQSYLIADAMLKQREL